MRSVLLWYVAVCLMACALGLSSPCAVPTAQIENSDTGNVYLDGMGQSAIYLLPVFVHGSFLRGA
jgi:hypothetical protein